MFSVIIPAYNAADFIKNAIESVLCQTEQNFEIIVVDDGSTDETSSVVRSITDGRIHYMYQENAGVSVARNTGISAAKGEYICFLDSDDRWKSNHLSVLKQLMAKYVECKVFITGHEIWLKNGDVIPNSKLRLKDILVDSIYTDNAYEMILKYGYFFHTNSMCCAKEVFDTVGFFAPGVKNGEDDDMWYRMFGYYSVAISMIITTCYSRENCMATVQRIRVLDWIFLRRLNSIYSNEMIPQDRKNSLKKLIERRKLSDIRYLIIQGRKGEAFKIFCKLNFPVHKLKRLLVTGIAFLIPTKIIRFYIDIRDKDYY